MKTGSAWAMGLLLSGSLLFGGGCALFAVGAGAAAGAGTGIYLTNRGAESTVPAGIEKTTEAARAAFNRWGIDETAYEIEKDGAKRVLTGQARGRDLKVTVELERRGDEESRVEVYARESVATWDKAYARKVLETIIERATGRAPEQAPQARAGGAGPR